MRTLLVLVVTSLSSVVSVAQAELPPLIPREVLFGFSDRSNPRISPDGKMLAYIQPYKGVGNIWVRTLGKNDDKAITASPKRGLWGYSWVSGSKQILFRQQKGGDENHQLYLVDVKTGEQRRLTNLEGVQVRVMAKESKFPDEILIQANLRDRRYHDVHRLNLKTGELTTVAENTEGFMGWLADHDYNVRAAMKVTKDATRIIYVRDDDKSPWRELISWGMEDALYSGPLDRKSPMAGIAFTPDNRGIYLISNAGSNTTRLCVIDIATGKEKMLHHDIESDIEGILRHPTKGTIQAVSHQKERLVWSVLDGDIKEDFDVLKNTQRGNFNIISRDENDSLWTVGFSADNRPPTYYLYDRKTKKAKFLFAAYSKLENMTFAKMKPVKFKSRDGLTIHGYLTIPPGLEPKNLPMVVNVHGGPWNRDRWGWNTRVQWLANRGYAVLQVNFRGSTSYGKDFLNASIREFGGKMDRDVVDGVKWAIAKGIADPKRTAIFGSSGGGWATLVGMTRWPDLYCCGVDLCGPSNLITFLNALPPYWKTWEGVWHKRVGHPVKDRDFLISRSPFYKVDRIKNPLLIAQGANDPRVNRYESMQMALALKRAGKVIEYVEYHNEGHGLSIPENRIDFHRRAEKFLAKYVGGRYEE